MLKNIVIFGGVALSLVIGFLGLTKESTFVTRNIVGSVSSPDISSPYFSVGGIPMWFARTENLVAATTTVCALQAPASTSTLEWGMIKLTTSSTTASTVTIAKAATAFATTTVLSRTAVSANAQATVIASSTATGVLDPAQVFAPNAWLVVSMEGGTGTFSPAGVCQASWIQI